MELLASGNRKMTGLKGSEGYLPGFSVLFLSSCMYSDSLNSLKVEKRPMEIWAAFYFPSLFMKHRIFFFQEKNPFGKWTSLIFLEKSS